MKNHIHSLLDPVHRWWTISFFLASIVLIIASQVVGINDNLPGIAMLFVGMILLFFALVHPWRDVPNYVILIGVCVGIILLTLLAAPHIGEAPAMFLLFLISLPGIVVGIIGALVCHFINK